MRRTREVGNSRHNVERGHFIKKMLILVVTYCLFFKPEVIFVPHSINLTLGVIGLFTFFVGRKTRSLIVQSSRFSIKDFVKILTPVFIVSILSPLVNASSDLFFFKYVLSLFLTIFSTYLLIYLIYTLYKEISFDKLTEYLIVATIIFLAISLIMFFYPGINDILVSLLRQDEGMKDALDINSGFRLIGFGVQFYTAGLVLGFVLIMIAFYACRSTLSLKKSLILFVVYIFVTITGMMMARTTLVGSAVGIGVIMYYKGKQLKKHFSKFILAICLLVAAIWGIQSYITKAMDDDPLFSFAFEAITNMVKDKNVSDDHSMGHMLEMYKTLPDNVKTWVIGDARWNENGHYYKDVDIGYLRYLFYFGLFGTVSLLFYFWGTLKLVFKKHGALSPMRKGPVLVLMLYTLILLLKGPADMFYYVLPYYFVFYQHNNAINSI